MASAIIPTFDLISKAISLYFGSVILAAGIIGGILNIIVLLSLQTFRQSPCAFYLTAMSFANLGQLLTGLLSRVMISGYGIDWTTISLFYCKVRIMLYQLCTGTSYTCLCLAILDQYAATCSHRRLQQWSNIDLARRIVACVIFIWIVHAIPYPIFFAQVVSSTTGSVECVTTNATFLQYRAYFVVLVLTGFLPVTITVLFGILAYRNVQHLAYRAVPLVRRELDKQLTTMVLTQVLLNFFTNLPFAVINALTVNSKMTTDPVVWANLQFAYVITLLFSYSYFASPFYIYICASERYRRQLKHVLFEIHWNRCRKPPLALNQVKPAEYTNQV